MSGGMVRCRGCGAEIIWLRTPAGKPIPCDPEAVWFVVEAGGKDRIVTVTGTVYAGRILSGQDEAGYATTGYQSHFATCPKAGRFRTKEGAGTG